ncbi:glycosyltransferase family 4 protein [Pengzhenrongella sicca]|uniref:Glycosyltransferase family 4 protein n=1 Tax=Pengzhenrongella sicca TaxID=2819238 RepID=A0A8A4ZAE1_9MICO|nr:glycosyltransferase family 4 protein [Pengzhenrongella sicca]QTE28892.1 glycosyltransferase family 4 protein [Pengzhenrongella sicca]
MAELRPWLLIAAAADRYGADAMLVYVAGHLRDRQPRVRVVLPEDGPLRELIAERGIAHEVSPTFVLRKRLAQPAFGLRELARTPARIVRHVRLLRAATGAAVYVNTVTVPLWPLLARAAGRPTVIHVHEILGGGSGRARLVRRALYVQLFAAGRVICVSDAVRRDVLAAWPRLADRAVTVLNADFEAVARAEPLEPAPDARDLVVVGRLSPRKGQHVVLEAIAGLDPARRPSVALVGTVFTGYEWYETKLREVAAEHGIDARFPGYLPKEEGFAAGAVVVVPSTVPDPAPLVVIEALARGCVVLAARTGGIPELLGSAGILFEPDDAGSLRAALVQVAELTAAQRRDLRSGALKRAGELSATAYWDQLDAVLVG